MNLAKSTTRVAVLMTFVVVGIALYEYRAHRTSEVELREVSPDRAKPWRKKINRDARLGILRADGDTTTKTIERSLYDSWNGMTAKQQLEAAYAALFKSWGLTPSKLEQVEDLMIEQQQECRDALVEAVAQRIDIRTGGRDLVSIVIAAAAPINQQLQALLGPSAYGQLLHSEETLPMRSIATDLQRALSLSSTPLSEDKANQLTQVLSEWVVPNPALVVSVTLDGPLFPIRAGRITNEEVTQASAVLSDQQLQALMALQKEDLDRGNDPQITFVQGLPTKN